MIKLVQRSLVLAAMTTFVTACSVVPKDRPSATQTPVSQSPVIVIPEKSPTGTIIPNVPIFPAPVAVVKGTTGASLGVIAGPDFSSLKITEEMAARALTAFKATCGTLQRRKDLSGLATGPDWTPACTAAKSATGGTALDFFATNFEVAQVGDGKAFATGYYEPEILGSRTRSPEYDVPIYAKPPELVELDLGEFSETLKGRKLRGMVKGNTFVPFSDRTQIETGALEGRGLEIAYAASAVDFFVLQVQGSGKLRLPDGKTMRIAYAGQNGRDYTGIGKVMKDRGLLQPGRTGMDDLTAWLKANPEQGKAIMRENRSWVFFKESNVAGAIGALNVPVTGRTSVATDPMFVPLGAPVVLSMDRAEASGLWVAQDTGGAIKGSNRFDTFWGEGAEAKRIAGGMSSRGTAFILLPKGSIARLTPGGASGGAQTQR